ncbi:methylmalonyl-CoA mutase metallochaperone MeaB [Stella humosa]|uniref:Methylmalonyl-CoA mutase metallochaperone MeaB n=1 Tax=Stella humosa TaxID=94 RepID=A0A3N1KZH4_9PROT|nr:methylmalonyl Co-A mutase-associated GTPase MeaB [Stella humosa]ROP84050.1 methylmalonyl-CoA mutase metallochaperone MeaB [Stella humosa]BBK33561.1 ATPase/protein kinase [Stella humosa]
MADSGRVEALARGVRAGERRALARAITLVESSRDEDRPDAEALLAALLPDSGRSIRLGISGVPGVGKSTFIEAFGLHVIGRGHRVAVLAVDPSSKVSGGSILGDKTRMEMLSRHPHAFIRPSPAGRTLGGVARRTREAMLLVEAAGFDVVIVETVGVGQSETTVAEMVDLFLLLLLPGGGDELQGLKKGIVEIADLLLVNKADGDLAPAAKRTAADYRGAVRMLRPSNPPWKPEVEPVSAVTGEGLAAAWGTVERYRTLMDGAGALARRRGAQARSALWTEIESGLLAAFRQDPAIADRIAETERLVTGGRQTPAAAGRDLVGRFLGRKSAG